MHINIPGKLCRGCQKELGTDEYVLITDKISRGLHAFHVRCQPRDPDVQRHYGAFLLPANLTAKGKDLG